MTKKDVIVLTYTQVIEVDENNGEFITLKEALEKCSARTIDSHLTIVSVNEGDITESELAYAQSIEAIVYELTGA